MSIHSKSNIGFTIADNGSIGEARAKSFLIDRFWILERSIDRDGADFIIQRKITNQNILDNLSPRFGIIQAKFSSNENTYHYVKHSYVVDENDIPHKEFFLILNFGIENSKKMCLLSAKDIVTFKLNSDNKYVLPTKMMLKKFQIKNSSLALDQIENSIQEAEFMKNRLLIFNNLEKVNPDFEAISPEFKYNIDYSDGNIIDLFKEFKENAYNFILEIEEMHSILSKFISETNPVSACLIAEEFDYKFDGSFTSPYVFDKDFYYKSQRYINLINDLKNDNILENYLELPNQIKLKVNNYINQNIDIFTEDSKLYLLIKYSKIDFSNLLIEFNLVKEKSERFCYEFKLLEEGNIELSFNIGLSIINKEKLIEFNECCVIDIVNHIYELKYKENEESTNFHS